MWPLHLSCNILLCLCPHLVSAVERTELLLQVLCFSMQLAGGSSLLLPVSTAERRSELLLQILHPILISEVSSREEVVNSPPPSSSPLPSLALTVSSRENRTPRSDPGGCGLLTSAVGGGVELWISICTDTTGVLGNKNADAAPLR